MWMLYQNTIHFCGKYKKRCPERSPYYHHLKKMTSLQGTIDDIVFFLLLTFRINLQSVSRRLFLFYDLLLNYFALFLPTLKVKSRLSTYSIFQMDHSIRSNRSPRTKTYFFFFNFFFSCLYHQLESHIAHTIPSARSLKLT